MSTRCHSGSTAPHQHSSGNLSGMLEHRPSAPLLRESPGNRPPRAHSPTSSVASSLRESPGNRLPRMHGSPTNSGASSLRESPSRPSRVHGSSPATSARRDSHDVSFHRRGSAAMAALRESDRTARILGRRDSPSSPFRMLALRDSPKVRPHVFSREDSVDSNESHGVQPMAWWQMFHGSTLSDSDLSITYTLRERMQDDLLMLCHDISAMYRAVSVRILLYCATLVTVLTAAGCVLLYLWCLRIEEGRSTDARGIALSVSQWIEAEVFHLSDPLFTIATLATRSPGILSLSAMAASLQADPQPPGAPRLVPELAQDIQEEYAVFTNLAQQTIPEEIQSNIVAFGLAPRGIVSLVSGDDTSQVGMDLISEYPDALLAAIRSNSPSAVGPVPLMGDRGLGVVVHMPFFVNRSVADTIDTRAYPAINAEVSKGENFWGFISVALNVSKMFNQGQAVERLAFHGLRFCFSAPTRDSSPQSDFYRSSPATCAHDAVTVNVTLPHLVWELRVERTAGGLPAWLGASCAGIAVGALLVGALFVLILVSHEQNKRLLYRIMPQEAVEMLAQGRQVVQAFETATIFFSHLVGFNDVSSREWFGMLKQSVFTYRSSPLEIVALLNELYIELDKLAAKHKVFKVDTIGDVYMVVGGAPGAECACTAAEGAARVARFALEALEVLETKDVSGMRLRAGMSSGPVVAAVLGTEMPKYSFFGDTVNTASRMESTGEGGRLQVTAQTKRLLEESKETIHMVPRDRPVLVKGKGVMETFWVSRDGVRNGSGLSAAPTLRPSGTSGGRSRKPVVPPMGAEPAGAAQRAMMSEAVLHKEGIRGIFQFGDKPESALTLLGPETRTQPRHLAAEASVQGGAGEAERGEEDTGRADRAEQGPQEESEVEVGVVEGGPRGSRGSRGGMEGAGGRKSLEVVSEVVVATSFPQSVHVNAQGARVGTSAVQGAASAVLELDGVPLHD